MVTKENVSVPCVHSVSFTRRRFIAVTLSLEFSVCVNYRFWRFISLFCNFSTKMRVRYIHIASFLLQCWLIFCNFYALFWRMCYYLECGRALVALTFVIVEASFESTSNTLTTTPPILNIIRKHILLGRNAFWVFTYLNWTLYKKCQKYARLTSIFLVNVDSFCKKVE